MGLYSSYYAYGLPTFTVIVIALYLLFTGKNLLIIMTEDWWLKALT